MQPAQLELAWLSSVMQQRPASLIDLSQQAAPVASDMHRDAAVCKSINVKLVEGGSARPLGQCCSLLDRPSGLRAGGPSGPRLRAALQCLKMAATGVCRMSSACAWQVLSRAQMAK